MNLDFRSVICVGPEFVTLRDEEALSSRKRLYFGTVMITSQVDNDKTLNYSCLH